MSKKLESETKTIDMTKTGPLSFRLLRELNSMDVETPELDAILASTPGTLSSLRGMGKVSYTPGFDDYGDSSYDQEIVTYDLLVNKDEIRAKELPWYALIVAGLAKGAVLAGTTFLDGTLGLIVGGATAIGEGRVSGLWNNDFSKIMKSWQEASEKALPNYYTKEEQNSPWYENIFTSNFIGDKFIKNLGFSVGAIYSGSIYAAPFRTAKVANMINNIFQTTKAAPAVSSIVGSTLAAVSEGRIEALNNSTDWFNLLKLLLDDWYDLKLEGEYAPLVKSAMEEYEATKGTLVAGPDGRMYDPAYQSLLNKLAVLTLEMEYRKLNRDSDEIYRKALIKISEDRLKMGNADLLMNIPILTASNWYQFGKMFAGGYRTARKASNVVKRADQYVGGSTNLGGVIKAIGTSLAEGSEELSLKIASVSAGKYYADDVSNYHKAKIDPDAELETLDWIKSIGQGINETINEGSSWEEFFIGSLTGALGIPMFRGIKSSEGGFQSPVKMAGGAWNTWKEHKQTMARELEIANYLNLRIQSPDFLSGYQGLIRHNKYLADMNLALENGDEFNFKNAEHAQFVSDITMFDNAGRLGDLEAIINTALDTSEENLEAIVRNTTSIIEERDRKKAAGPYAQYARIESDGSIEVDFGNSGREEMMQKVNQNKEELLNTIESYRKIKDELDIATGERLSDEQLSELTWMRSLVNNWQERAKAMSSVVKESLLDLSSNLESTLLKSIVQANENNPEGVSEKVIELIGDASNKLGIGGERIKQLRELATLGSDVLTNILTNSSNKQFVELLIEDISAFGSGIINHLGNQNVVTLLLDLIKTGTAIDTYTSKLKEYLEDPAKLELETQEATEQVAALEAEKKSLDIKSRLSSAKSVSEMKTLILKEEDHESALGTLKLLELEGNAIAKNYRETLQYNKEILNALNGLGETSRVTEDARILWENHFEHAENLEMAGNPNSIFLNNDTTFDDDSEGNVEMSLSRFHEARYAILRAISKVNNDIQFRDRFSAEYKKPIEKVNNPKGVNLGTTGNDPTPTVPPVAGSSSTIDSTAPIPIGDRTVIQVLEENEEFNNAQEDPLSFEMKHKDGRKYYAPTIPELHIQASKEGDFRPFDIVVSEREAGADYSVIYKYLTDEKSFEYVNSGKIKPGDKIGFMIDPKFEEDMKASLGDKYKGPTIFFVHGENNQVVGDVASSTAGRFEGLEDLVGKIKSEFENSRKLSDGDITTEVSDKDGVKTTKFNRHNGKGKIYTGGGITINSNKIDPSSIEIENLEEDTIQLLELREADGKIAGTIRAKVKDGGYTTFEVKFISNPVEGLSIKSILTDRFLATPTTKVSQVMVGKIPYTKEDRDLADIPGILDSNNPPIFGIVLNGVVVTNNKIPNHKIITPIQLDRQHEGRLYLLIPNAAGTYSPAAVRVKHFNEEEFNLEDPTVLSTVLGKSINNAIKLLANVSSKEEIPAVMKSLGLDIFLRDVMVTWFDAAAGSGIVLSRKIRKPDGSYEITTINGKLYIKEEKKSVYFLSNKKKVTIGGVEYPVEAVMDPEKGIDPSLVGLPKSEEEISKEILNILYGYNLPLLVRAREINNTGENNRLIKSGVLSSNLREARVISNWFTTDYFDADGKLQKAENPPSRVPNKNKAVTNPVGGLESTIVGIKVNVPNHPTRYVELSANTIRDDKGNNITSSMSVYDLNLYFNLAWALLSFGSSTESPIMTNNIVIVPGGRVLNRTTGTYLQGEEADKIKTFLEERTKRVTKSEEVLAAILENQAKVDKTRTDENAYYILEEDGTYHPYSRVHQKLGDNWTGLSNESNASKVALQLGSAVDTVVRDFFNTGTATRPDSMTEEAFLSLINRLNEIKESIKEHGEEFYANNIVLFHKYADGTRVAGEVDILARTREGNFKIYDVKTSKNGFGLSFETRWGRLIMSTKEYYTKLLSSYKNLFESLYGVPIIGLGLIPFTITYSSDNKIATLTPENSISVKYDSTAPVLLEKLSSETPKATTTTTVLPIFNASLELKNPVSDINDFLKLNLEGVPSLTGYYEIDGVLHKGYIAPLDTIDNVIVHFVKIPDLTRGAGKDVEHAAFNTYYAVFPNGKSIKIINKAPATGANAVTDTLARNLIILALKGNLNRVHAEAIEDTILTENTPLIASTEQSNASKALEREARVLKKDEEFEDDLDLGSLRKTDNEVYKLWDRKLELAWLEKVLPQLSVQDRLQVVSGLILVAENGPVAWGRFKDGIVTLSDIAAEGTAYHEAFHVVFQTMLSPLEREHLFREAKAIYGNKSYVELEEDMAEGFREYVQTQNEKGLLARIKNFFKNLWIKITNWKLVYPHLTAYYLRINSGLYANSSMSQSKNSNHRLREEKSNQIKSAVSNIGTFSTENDDIRYRMVPESSRLYLELAFRKEAQVFLDNFGITIKDVENYNSKEPLFDALNRVINIRKPEDISEGMGYAITFMMQYHPIVLDLISLHVKGLSPRDLSSVRRSLNKRGSVDLKYSKLELEAKQKALEQIGKDVATELRKLYRLLLPQEKPNSYIRRILDFIKEFFNILTPKFRMTIDVISRGPAAIANAVKLNDASIIRNTRFKPGTNVDPVIVDIEQALLDNTYEEEIISNLSSKGIALAGSASIALEGTLHRPSENPLHDIDFLAKEYDRESLDNLLKEMFLNIIHIREIVDGEEEYTETYLTLDRPFKLKKAPSDRGVDENKAEYLILDPTTNKVLGQYTSSELTLSLGVKGKFLDFFIGKNSSPYGKYVRVLNGKPYLVSDYRNAFNAKIDWARRKDIWDYNRFISHSLAKDLKEAKRLRQEKLRNKLLNARVIWGHPAIGKTTYMERNDDILEWDEIVNAKRDDFIRNQIDPGHKMDITSTEYKDLRSDYMAKWREHPEYINFLTLEWQNLLARGKRENKRIFASPLPLLEIGRNDFDLIVAINNRDFQERNEGRGNSALGSRGWKMNIDEALLLLDPSKVEYTDDYFSDFMRNNLGVTWGTLTQEEEQNLVARGWTREMFDSVSQAERDNAVECAYL